MNNITGVSLIHSMLISLTLTVCYFLLSFIYNRNKGSIIKSLIKRAVCIFLVTLLINVIILLVFGSLITIYEQMLTSITILLIIHFFMYSYFMKKGSFINNLLYFVFFESIFISIYSVLTYCQANIHSDDVSAFLLVKSIIKNRCIFPKSWNYANGDIWVFSLWPECLLPVAFVGNAALARALGSVISIVLAIVCIVYMCKTIFHNNCWLIATPLILIYAVGASEMILYQAAYIQNFPIFSLAITWIYKALIEKDSINYRYLILTCLLMAVCCIGGIRFIAELSLPLLLTPVLYFVLEKDDIEKKKIKKVVLFEVVIIFASIIGYLIYLWLCSWHNMNFSASSSIVFSDSINTIFNNILRYVAHIFEIFGFTGGCSAISIHGLASMSCLVIGIVLFFVIPYIQCRNYRNQSKTKKWFLSFVLCHNTILFLSIVLFEKNNVWYLLTSLFLLIIMFSMFIYDDFYKYSVQLKTIIICIFVVFFAIYSTVVLLRSVNWKQTIDNKREYCKEILEKDVSKIYASFDNTYGYYIYSDTKLSCAPIYINKDNGNIGKDVITFDTQYVLNDNSIYDYIEGINSALLLSEDEYKIARMHGDLKRVFGEYSESIVNNMHLLIFDHDISNCLYNGIRDNIIAPSENIFIGDGSGIKEYNQIQVYPDGCTSGPYISLEKGKYSIKVIGYNLDNAKLNVCSFTSPNVIDTTVLDNSLESIEANIEINEDVKNVEFQVYNRLIDKNIYIYSFEIIKID